MPTDGSPNNNHDAITRLADGAQCYARAHGLDMPALASTRVYSCPTLGCRIAYAYLTAPLTEPAARPAYVAFREENWRQLDFLLRPPRRGGLGIDVTVCRADPYSSLAELLSALTDQRLRIWATSECGNPHPWLSNDDNDAFRAVHDAFGHGATGRGFDVHGEEAAWFKHCHMYSPLARRAMTTETRGQNCALIYGCDGQQFPIQKAVLLAPEYADPRSVRLRPLLDYHAPRVGR